MNAETGDASSVKPITSISPVAFEQQVAEARRLFRRTLASWASDLLILRSRGMRAVHWTPQARRNAA